jgi:hypothetical protein
MNALKFHGRFALSILAVACFGVMTANAQTSLDFTPFEFDGVSNPSDLEYIDLNAFIVTATGGVTVSISNQSQPGDPGVTGTRPTVTRIFFEDRTGTAGNDVTIFSQSGGVMFTRTDGENLPGGTNIGFEVDSAFSANNPRPVNGIDPGESIVFLFNGATYEQVRASVASGDFRIAMHVQEIGRHGEDSAAFVNVIPEPGSALTLLLGGMLLLRRRR